MKIYFNIRYEFDRDEVHRAIERRLTAPESDYICVADGVILNTAHRDAGYLNVINGGMFSICDSSYVPLYIRWIYGHRYRQYCGSEIMSDIVRSRKYRMIFLGAQEHVLEGLRSRLSEWNEDVMDMKFIELPFMDMKDFNYPDIARQIEEDGAEIVWIALGAPKQEQFMALLKPHLHHGVMIAVGAVFKFFSGVGTRRAPDWMVRNHLEFVHRLATEPGKQFRRCFDILRTLPALLLEEWRRKQAVRPDPVE